jgi:SAM-dependent methyltransferase
MDTRVFVLKLFRSLRRNGLRFTLREGLWAIKKPTRESNEFDVKYGTDTGGLVQLWHFKIRSPNARYATAYIATEEQALVDAISALPDDPRTLTFIDLGCGKGRALLVAAKLGFKQVIGVEFAHELAETAKKNLEILGITNAVVEHADAAEYHFPSGDIVVYLYNPFHKEVLQKVIENLKRSLPKKVYVIYGIPACAALFDSCDFLARLNLPNELPDMQIWSAITPL